tara:strand:+ start:6824 stop:7219 length:396 start_codon:yes stop_codon:yes gene_type:complete
MAMNNNFEKNVKQQLDMSVTTLDAMTQSQLTQARYKALAYAQTKRLNISRWFTGLASAAVVALLVITVMPTQQTPVNQQVAVTNTNQQLATSNQQLAADPEWLLASDTDEIELYKNLAFYIWFDDTVGSNS